MPIINPNQPSAPTPQERLQNRAVSFSNQLNQQYNQIITLATQVAEFVWRNPLGMTPQQVFDAFGTNAGDLVKISQAYTILIQTYTGVAPQITPPGFKVTVNNDGTVTVGTTP